MLTNVGDDSAEGDPLLLESLCYKVKFVKVDLMSDSQVDPFELFVACTRGRAEVLGHPPGEQLAEVHQLLFAALLGQYPLALLCDLPRACKIDQRSSRRQLGVPLELFIVIKEVLFPPLAKFKALHGEGVLTLLTHYSLRGRGENDLSLPVNR